MNTINYDFTDLENVMFNLKSDQSASRLRSLKDELNKFFKDSTCKEILYTNNTDKPFFGMYVIPIMTGDDAMKILSSNERVRIESYIIEIDSKLLSPILSLSARELVAVLLHEVGHMVNTSAPVDEVRKATDVYLHKQNQHLSLASSKQYKELLAFAIKNSLRKLTTIFEKNKDEEILADEFVVRCGYGLELESALGKIVSNNLQLNDQVRNKLVVLQWTLRLYKNVKMNRVSALHALNRGKTITASVLEKREIDNVIRNLQQIDDDRLIVESVDIIRNMGKSLSDAYRSFKYKGVRALEDDYFELALRVKNIDDQEEAIMTLRQINLRLSMIDDYMRTEKLNPGELDKWDDLLNKYRELRDVLAKKQTYSDKYYGLFVKTPVIKSRYEM